MGAAVVLMPAQFTVTVGTASVECQLSEATYSTDVTEATIKTLCAENKLATNESGKLKLAGYQDFTEPDGLCNFLWENALAEGEFVISGTDAAGATAVLTGTMQCRRPPFGPTADDAAKFDVECPTIGIPTLVVTPGTMRSASAA